MNPPTYVIYRVTMDLALRAEEASKPPGTVTIGHWEHSLEATLLGWSEIQLSTPREMVWDNTKWTEAPAEPIDLTAAGARFIESLNNGKESQ